jgi:hypothetical protein
MSRKLCLAGMLAVAMATGACTSFETSRETLSPSAPPPLTGGSAAGPLVGLWAPPQGVAAPSAATCANTIWEITSQSDTAVAGTFSTECAGGLRVSANVTGALSNATTVTLHLTGTGVVRGLGCPFTLDGIGTIFDNSNAITIPYTGTTCFGPVSGTETLRRPTPPPPPVPPPPPPPGPGPSPWHIGPGSLTALRANQIVVATGNEFPNLLAPIGDTGQKTANADEMLRRVIWHMQLAGYQSARQRNPSGAISTDKLAIMLDDQRWHAFDIMTNFDIGGIDTRLLFLEVTPPNPIADGGVPD